MFLDDFSKSSFSRNILSYILIKKFVLNLSSMIFYVYEENKENFKIKRASMGSNDVPQLVQISVVKTYTERI